MKRRVAYFALEIILVILIIGLGCIIPFTKTEAVEELQQSKKNEMGKIFELSLRENLEVGAEKLFSTLEKVDEIFARDNMERMVEPVDAGCVAETYKLSVNNIDFDSQDAIEGTEFELYDSEGNKIYSWVSSKKPECIDLRMGTYRIKETKVADNYVKNAEDLLFTINEDGSITNSVGERIDTEFLYAQELAYQGLAENVGSVTNVAFDAQSLERTEDLSEGVYMVVAQSNGQLGYPEGVVNNTSDFAGSVQSANVKNEEEFVSTLPTDSGSISVSNRHIDTTIKLTELDAENQEALEGAVFGIYSKSNDKLVYTSEATNENGVVVLYRVPLDKGSYYIREIKAPRGYELSNEMEDFTVSGTNSFEVTLENSSKSIAIVDELKGNMLVNVEAEKLVDLKVLLPELVQAEYVPYVVLFILAIAEMGCMVRVALR